MHFSISAYSRQMGTIIGDQYYNGYLGLSFSKPAAWHFLSETELHSLPDSQTYEWDDDQMDDLYSEIGLPLVSLVSSKTAEESSPQADVWVQENDDEWEDAVFTQTETFVGLYAELLKDFTFEEPPAPIYFCGINGAVCTSTFLYVGTSGHTAPVRVKSLLLPTRKLVFSINIKAACSVWDADLDAAFDAFLDSFKIDADKV